MFPPRQQAAESRLWFGTPKIRKISIWLIAVIVWAYFLWQVFFNFVADHQIHYSADYCAQNGGVTWPKPQPVSGEICRTTCSGLRAIEHDKDTPPSCCSWPSRPRRRPSSCLSLSICSICSSSQKWMLCCRNYLLRAHPTGQSPTLCSAQRQSKRLAASVWILQTIHQWRCCLCRCGDTVSFQCPQPTFFRCSMIPPCFCAWTANSSREVSYGTAIRSGPGLLGNSRRPESRIVSASQLRLSGEIWFWTPLLGRLSALEASPRGQCIAAVGAPDWVH